MIEIQIDLLSVLFEFSKHSNQVIVKGSLQTIIHVLTLNEMQFLTKLTFLPWLVLFLELLLSIYDEDELTKKRNLQNVQGLFWLRFLSLSKFPMKLLFYPSNKVI